MLLITPEGRIPEGRDGFLEASKVQVVATEPHEEVVGDDLRARKQRAEAVAERGIDAAAGKRPPADFVVGDLDAGAIVSKESAQGLTTFGDEGDGFGCEVSELVLGREGDRSRFLDLALSQPLGFIPERNSLLGHRC
jgi:hypothetical protein